MEGGHRSPEFNRVILPRCHFLIESAGQRLAYEAALSANVSPILLAIYETGSIRQDSSWYLEKGGISREKQFEMEIQALDAGLPLLDQLLDQMDVEPYCTAPILSESLMEKFNDGLTTYGGVDMAMSGGISIAQSKL